MAGVALVGALAAAFGGGHLALHVWEVVLVGGLFVSVGACLFLLFRRVGRLEGRPEPSPEPPPPKEHAGLLREITDFEGTLAGLGQDTASWAFAEVYHELRARSINAAPQTNGLANLPVVETLPSIQGGLANIGVPELRVYLQRMATLLEADETRPRGPRTRANIQ